MLPASQKSLSRLIEISRHMVSTLDLDEVISRVLGNSVGYVGAERGMLIVINAARKPEAGVVYVDGRLVPSAADTVDRLLDGGLAGRVMQTGEMILIPNTSQDARWMRRPDDDSSQSGPKSAICTPVKLHDGRLVGILTLVHSQPGALNEQHTELLTAVADQAAIAIYNAQQYHSVENAQLHYQQLYEDNIDPVLITDWHGQIQEANRMAAKMSAYSAAELAGMNIAALHRPDWSALGENFSALQTGRMAGYESNLLCKAGKPGGKPGSTIPIQVNAQQIVFRQETRIQWVLRDISAQRELAALRDELQAMVYHDLRSPLSNVASGLDLINEMLPEGQVNDLKPLVDIVQRATERVKRLADTLLDIHAIEAGQEIIHKQAVSVQQLSADALDAIRISAEVRGHTLANEIPSNLPAIMGDEEILRRVYINLLDNAIRFTPAHGHITLGGMRKDRQMLLWVDDDGPGIPPADRERIFDKFTRNSLANSALEASVRSLGIGLAFCRLAISAHGGKIWYEAKEPHGSRFIFSLPVE
jgi:NtrC-family two-component system sensor histidine kinase KinB